MADLQVIECTGACTVTVVHEIKFPLFEMTPQEGAQIAGAVLAVWAVGWVFRAIPLHTSPRLAELSGVAGALDKDGYLLQAQP